MRCLVTGHTKGIGLAIYQGLVAQGFSVDGISRGTNYDISTEYSLILSQAVNYDLVVNNAYHPEYQIKLLEDLAGKVKNIISIGSVAGYYSEIVTKKHQYTASKKKLIELNKRLSYQPNSNLLLINVGLAENASADFGCSYQDIVDTCLFWIKHPNIHQIDFKVPLTDLNVSLIEADFGISLSDHQGKFF